MILPYSCHMRSEEDLFYGSTLDDAVAFPRENYQDSLEHSKALLSSLKGEERIALVQLPLIKPAGSFEERHILLCAEKAGEWAGDFRKEGDPEYILRLLHINQKAGSMVWEENLINTYSIDVAASGLSRAEKNFYQQDSSYSAKKIEDIILTKIF